MQFAQMWKMTFFYNSFWRHSTQVPCQFGTTTKRPKTCTLNFNPCSPTVFNPNSTGQGQSWPRQLWHQIPDKILIYQIFLFDLFLQKRLQNLFELLTWRQKTTFWHPFWCFFIRSSVALLLCRHPHFRPVLLLLQTTRAREKSGQTKVRSAERRQ